MPFAHNVFARLAPGGLHVKRMGRNGPLRDTSISLCRRGLNYFKPPYVIHSGKQLRFQPYSYRILR